MLVSSEVTTPPFITLLLCLGLLLPVYSHSRWSCPEPRSSNTGIKSGPCGNDYDDFTNTTSIPIVRPGPMRVIFEESISHRGSPFRISLSADGTDDPSQVCVLLDHIPHNDGISSRPRLSDESTYIPYVITIDIPNVQCDRCSLHLSNPMTDKIGSAGSPGAIGCTDPDGTCFSVYHSCTQPIQIIGTTPRDEYICPGGMPFDWPTVWVGDGGADVDASEPFLYRRQASEWSSEDHMLQTVPDRYREDVGICGRGYDESLVTENMSFNVMNESNASMVVLTTEENEGEGPDTETEEDEENEDVDRIVEREDPLNTGPSMGTDEVELSPRSNGSSLGESPSPMEMINSGGDTEVIASPSSIENTSSTSCKLQFDGILASSILALSIILWAGQH